MYDKHILSGSSSVPARPIWRALRQVLRLTTTLARAFWRVPKLWLLISPTTRDRHILVSHKPRSFSYTFSPPSKQLGCKKYTWSFQCLVTRTGLDCVHWYHDSIRTKTAAFVQSVLTLVGSPKCFNSKPLTFISQCPSSHDLPCPNSVEEPNSGSLPRPETPWDSMVSSPWLLRHFIYVQLWPC